VEPRRFPKPRTTLKALTKPRKESDHRPIKAREPLQEGRRDERRQKVEAGIKPYYVSPGWKGKSDKRR